MNWEILASVEIPSSGAFFGGGADLKISYLAWDGTNSYYPQDSSAISGLLTVTVNAGDTFEVIHQKAAVALRTFITSDPATVRFIESPGAY